MSQLRLYNSLTKQIQDFIPVCEGKVSLYCCGPTVYNYAHIGNFRTYIFEDILVRVLRMMNYQIRHVMNITDIGHLSGDSDDGEDKMLKSARERQSTVLQIAEFFTKKFFEDAASLNIQPPSQICAATAHIQDMIAMIKKIEAEGFTYHAGGNVYFDTAKYAQYGTLRGYGIKNTTHHHRVDVDQFKKNSEDFVLWFTKSKFEEQALHWDSPWGEGYPGWHVECSAMSLHYLGESFDIHCGGVDHISVHHTNEIAQNYAYCGHIGAQIWMHGEFLSLNKEKMSKSAGNFFTVDSLNELGFNPLDYRYLCMQTHYRKPLAFHDEAILSAKQARGKLIQRICTLQKEVLDAEALLPDLREHFYWKQFKESLCNDLNCPEALAVMWKMLKDEALSAPEKLALVQKMDQVLALGLSNLAYVDNEPDEQWMDLIRQREQARKEKNYAEADRLRDILLQQGIIIKDSPNGTTWERK